MSVARFGSQGPDHDQPGFDPLAVAWAGVYMAHNGEGRAEPNTRYWLHTNCSIGDYVAALPVRPGLRIGLACQAAHWGLGNVARGPCWRLPWRRRLESSCSIRGAQIWILVHPNCAASPLCTGPITVLTGNGCTFRSRLRSIGKLCVQCFSEARLEGPEGNLALASSRHFASHPSTQLLEQFSQLKVPTLRTNHLADLFGETQLRANDLLVELHYSAAGMVAQVGLLAKFF
jgi:hypothetical protein